MEDRVINRIWHRRISENNAYVVCLPPNPARPHIHMRPVSIKDEREQQEELFSLNRGLFPVQSQKEDSHIITPNATINHTRQSHRQFQVV